MHGLRHLFFLSIVLILSAALSACSDFDYYLHTANGHMEVMAERKPIPELLEAEETPEELRTKLREIAWIRHFASDRLSLPDNKSYQSYVELDRPYVVWNVVATPELDYQKLPGITRLMLLDILRKDGSIPVEERKISLAQLLDADEVWITSSSKEIAPVIEIDGKPVGDGQVGDVWLAAQTLYTRHKFDY